MNKKGFTIAETLVTFVLVAFIGLSLLQLLLNYKDLASIKMKQQTYASIKDEITSRIQKHVKRRGLLYIKQASPNSIYFVYSDKPSEPVALTVHSINYIDNSVASEYGKSSPDAMTGQEKYDAINKKYIEYDGVKYTIPSGLPDYTDSISDYFKYQGVNINMGNIYFESTPYDMTPTISTDDKFKTIYHVIVSLGVTDLDEDYGLDMVFVANTKGSNTVSRNLVLNSSFESSQFILVRDPNTTNYSDIIYTNYDSSTDTYSGETTCKGTSSYPSIYWNSDNNNLTKDGDKALGCRCNKNSTCQITLNQKVPITPGKIYTLSYLYRTNYGKDISFTDLGLTNVCCKSDNTCISCGPDTRNNQILRAQGNYQRIEYTFTAPAGVSYLKLMFKVAADDAGTNAVRIFIDAIQLEEGSTASTYQRT